MSFDITPKTPSVSFADRAVSKRKIKQQREVVGAIINRPEHEKRLKLQ